MAHDDSRGAAGSATQDRSALLLGWRRYVPESIGIILLLVLADQIFFDGSRYAWAAPRPFWIPIILISAQYGLAGGVFATMAATLALYSSSLPSQLATQDYYAYSRLIVAEPTGWLACALVLGGLRSLHIFHATELRRQRDDAVLEAEAIGHGLSDAMSEINRLEMRIAGETRTIMAVAQAFGRIAAPDAATRAARAAEFGRLLIGAQSLTIHGIAAGGSVVLAAADARSPRAADAVAPLSPDLLATLQIVPDGVWRCDRKVSAEMLPRGVVIAVGIGCPDGSGPCGMLVVERLQPHQDFGTAVARTQDVARGLGALLGAGGR